MQRVSAFIEKLVKGKENNGSRLHLRRCLSLVHHSFQAFAFFQLVLFNSSAIACNFGSVINRMALEISSSPARTLNTLRTSSFAGKPSIFEARCWNRAISVFPLQTRWLILWQERDQCTYNCGRRSIRRSLIYKLILLIFLLSKSYVLRVRI